MNEIKISVIIPVYNAEKYLEECLKSVTNQTLKSIEIICVDDGSSDNSLSILKSFAGKDSRIKIITQENQFAGAARNRGFREANGKYAAFWDCDDYFEKNALEILYKKCEEADADICLCGAYSVDSETGSRRVDETFLKKRFLPKSRVFSAQSHPDYIFNMASNVPWQRLVRADLIREHSLEFQHLRHANDTYFTMLSMFYAKRITYTTAPLINYRTNNSESITGKASKDPLCAYEAYAAVYKKLRAEGIEGKALQSLHSKILSGLIRAIMLQTDDAALNKIYSKIRLEGLDFFELNNHSGDYYYFKNDYEDLCFIREHTLSEFLIYKFRKESRDRLFYKARAEQTLKIRLARRLSALIPADSSLYELGKKLLHFR